MQRIRLAYRDHDRTPVIYAIKEMAARHYDLDVDVLQIKGTEDTARGGALAQAFGRRE